MNKPKHFTAIFLAFVSSAALATGNHNTPQPPLPPSVSQTGMTLNASLANCVSTTASANGIGSSSSLAVGSASASAVGAVTPAGMSGNTSTGSFNSVLTDSTGRGRSTASANGEAEANAGTVNTTSIFSGRQLIGSAAMVGGAGSESQGSVVSVSRHGQGLGNGDANAASASGFEGTTVINNGAVSFTDSKYASSGGLNTSATGQSSADANAGVNANGSIHIGIRVPSVECSNC